MTQSTPDALQRQTNQQTLAWTRAFLAALEDYPLTHPIERISETMLTYLDTSLSRMEIVQDREVREVYFGDYTFGFSASSGSFEFAFNDSADDENFTVVSVGLMSPRAIQKHAEYRHYPCLFLMDDGETHSRENPDLLNSNTQYRCDGEAIDLWFNLHRLLVYWCQLLLRGV